MNGPEHYRKAEELLERAAKGQVEAQHAAIVAEAQVHATLALVVRDHSNHADWLQVTRG